MTKREQALAGLRRAKRILRQQGWTQGSYYDLDGRDAYCVVGAYLHAMELEGVVDQADDLELTYLKLEGENYIKEAFGTETDTLEETGSRNPVDFNDTPGRTKEEVLAYLDKRITRLETAV